DARFARPHGRAAPSRSFARAGAPPRRRRLAPSGLAVRILSPRFAAARLRLGGVALRSGRIDFRTGRIRPSGILVEFGRPITSGNLRKGSEALARQRYSARIVEVGHDHEPGQRREETLELIRIELESILEPARERHDPGPETARHSRERFVA